MKVKIRVEGIYPLSAVLRLLEERYGWDESDFIVTGGTAVTLASDQINDESLYKLRRLGEAIEHRRGSVGGEDTMRSSKITMGTRAEVEAAEMAAAMLGGQLLNCESQPTEKGDRKYSIGDRVQLHGLVEYPELNGEAVTVTNYRESKGDLNGYYIESDSGRVEPWLNFVWEKRLAELKEQEDDS